VATAKKKKPAPNPNQMLDQNGNPVSARQLAEDYGYAYAFLKQHSDVWKVFQAAVKNNYSPDRFKAAIRGTNWWTHTQASVRQYQLEVASDPKGVAAKVAGINATLAQRAAAMGAIMSSATLKKMASQAYMYNWNDAQIQAQLGNYVSAVNGVYHGAAANDADALKQMAWRNGINVPAASISSWVKAIESGKQTKDYYQQYIRTQAKALAPGFSRELDAGLDLFDIANPYMQAKAQILQLNPAGVDLFDPDVRKALSATGPDGKPTSKSLWEFEQDMRMKPEYLKTDTARDSAYSMAHKVLNDFGLMGA
jgi:hypothetical protein